jgi:ribosomal protein S18 acetylase RimI-like enzyme
MAVLIRPALEADLAATRDLLVATWHATYDAIYGAEKVADITGRWHSEDVLAAQLNADGAVFLNAFDDGRLVGTLFAGLQSDGSAMLHRLYIDPQWQGQGVGQALFSAGLTALGDPETVVLEVEPANESAVAFYEKLGFQVSGDVEQCGGDSGVPAIVMTRTTP